MMSQSLTSCCSSSTKSSQTVPQAPGLANSPSGFFRKNSGMIFLQGRTPAGVVDDDVNEDARAERMRGVGEFAKLVNAGGALVELDERGIHGGQIQRGIRTAETAEARVGRRRRMHRQQMENAAAELVDDERQLAGEVAEFSRRRQRGVTLRFERLELRVQFFVGGRGQIFCRAEQPGEGAVNGVGGAGKIRDGRKCPRPSRPASAASFFRRADRPWL